MKTLSPVLTDELSPRTIIFCLDDGDWENNINSRFTTLTTTTEKQAFAANYIKDICKLISKSRLIFPNKVLETLFQDSAGGNVVDWEAKMSNVYDKLNDKINDIFNGYYIIFNLVTSKIPNPLLVSLSNGISTANTVAEFVCLFLKKYIIKIDFHGIGINSAKNYHDKFIGFGYYNNRRIEYIKKNLTDTCTKYKISFSFN